MPPEQPEILYGFFCEHVRNETGGKITAIGIWGDLCRFLAQPPAIVPFAFHAYILNRARWDVPVRISLRIPGVEPIELRSQLNPSPTTVGTNVTLSFGVASFPEPGRIVATVALESNPPIVREFSMEIRFEPPVAMPSPA